VTNLDTGQRRVERLAAALLAFVSGHFGLGRTFFFLRRLRGRRRQGLGLIEEQVLLLRASRLALCGEQLTLKRLELFQSRSRWTVITRSSPLIASRSAVLP
jgi:hypothetical protein